MRIVFSSSPSLSLLCLLVDSICQKLCFHFTFSSRDASKSRNNGFDFDIGQIVCFTVMKSSTFVFSNLSFFSVRAYRSVESGGTGVCVVSPSAISAPSGSRFLRDPGAVHLNAFVISHSSLSSPHYKMNRIMLLLTPTRLYTFPYQCLIVQ